MGGRVACRAGESWIEIVHLLLGEKRAKSRPDVLQDSARHEVSDMTSEWFNESCSFANDRQLRICESIEDERPCSMNDREKVGWSILRGFRVEWRLSEKWNGRGEEGEDTGTKEWGRMGEKVEGFWQDLWSDSLRTSRCDLLRFEKLGRFFLFVRIFAAFERLLRAHGFLIGFLLLLLATNEPRLEWIKGRLDTDAPAFRWVDVRWKILLHHFE